MTQFHVTNWSPDGTCSNLKVITDVIEEVAKIQRKTGNNPILVHCRYNYVSRINNCSGYIIVSVSFDLEGNHIAIVNYIQYTRTFPTTRKIVLPKIV